MFKKAKLLLKGFFDQLIIKTNLQAKNFMINKKIR